jgi:hypothetical protein
MEEEAVAVADLWYAMELNSPHLRLGAGEKSARLAAVEKRHVYYLVSEQDLVDTDPGQGTVLAYVVEYKPKGFVVVSGDDELDPIVVFSVESGFRWDQPERNFFRYFLGTTMTQSFNCIAKDAQQGVEPEVHPNWERLRVKMARELILQEAAHEEPVGSVYVLWDTALWDQCWPYNERVRVVHGLTTDCIPTGCVATALAIKLRFHEWPLTGTSDHSYDDTWDNIQHNNHNVNYANQTYNWDNMPTGDLMMANADVADLMYHCGVGVESNYEWGCLPSCPGSGTFADTLDAATALNRFFDYIETERRTSNHFDHMKKSIRAGLLVQVASPGHSLLADGYRDTQSPYWHVNCGWSGTCNGWYNLSNFPINSTCAGGAVHKSCPYGQPSNYVYVDKDYTDSESGTVKEPYNTFAEGYTNCPSEGHLWLKGPKTYIASPTVLSKKMKIHSYEGDATVQP